MSQFLKETIDKMLSLGSNFSEEQLDLIRNDDSNTNELNYMVEYVMRKNLITKDNIKAKILVILMDKQFKKNQKIVSMDPKNGMKVKFSTISEFCEFYSTTQYESLAKEISNA